MSESEFSVVVDMVARECQDAKSKLALEGREPLDQHIRYITEDGIVGLDERVADVRVHEPPRFLARRIVDAIRSVDGKAEEIPVRRIKAVVTEIPVDPNEPIPDVVKKAWSESDRRKAESFDAKFAGLSDEPKTVEELKGRFYFGPPMDRLPATRMQPMARATDNDLSDNELAMKMADAGIGGGKEKVIVCGSFAGKTLPIPSDWPTPDAPKTLVAGDPGVVMVPCPADRVYQVKRLLSSPDMEVLPGELCDRLDAMLAEVSDRARQDAKKAPHADPSPALRDLADRLTRMQAMFEQSLLAPKQADGTTQAFVAAQYLKLLGKIEALDAKVDGLTAARKAGTRRG